MTRIAFELAFPHFGAISTIRVIGVAFGGDGVGGLWFLFSSLWALLMLS